MFDVSELKNRYSKVTVSMSLHVKEIYHGYQDIYVVTCDMNDDASPAGRNWKDGRFSCTGNKFIISSYGVETCGNAVGEGDHYFSGEYAANDLSSCIFAVFGAHGSSGDDWELSNVVLTVSFHN